MTPEREKLELLDTLAGRASSYDGCHQWNPDRCWICTRRRAHAGAHIAHAAYASVNWVFLEMWDDNGQVLERNEKYGGRNYIAVGQEMAGDAANPR